jgi:hypothetical protein
LIPEGGPGKLSSVRARVEELTFGTGEYAIVLRGVLRRSEEAANVTAD